jgi:hypothetical protein
MGTIQDGETHGDDVAAGGYIALWAEKSGLNGSPASSKPAAVVALAPGRLQTGDVHADVTEIVANAPKWNMT